MYRKHLHKAGLILYALLAGPSAFGQTAPVSQGINITYQDTGTSSSGLPQIATGTTVSFPWSSTKTYYIGEFVTYNNVPYFSTLEGNTGNQPDTHPADWQVLGGGLTSSTSNTPLPGAPTAEWLFTETAGSTFADSSGNGNSISNNGGTMSAQGVTFSAAGQALTTPVTGTYQTAMVCFTHNPGPMYVTNPATDESAIFEPTITLIGTTASGGTWLEGTDYSGGSRQNENTTVGTGFLNPAVVGSSGSGYVASPTAAINGGPHCLIHVRSSSSDLFYYDGALQNNLYTTGSSGFSMAGATVLGGYSRSGTVDTNHWFWGTYHMVVLWPTALTPTQVAQAEAFATSNLTQRGLPAPGASKPPVSDGVSRLAIVGNSISACAALSTASNCWNLNLALTNSSLQNNIVRSALGGTTATFMTTTAPVRHEPLMASNAPYNTVLLWDGINDGCRYGDTPDQQWAEEIRFALREHSLGYKVVVGSMIDDGASGTCGGGLTPTQYKHAYNAIVDALWSQWFDGIADFAANPIIGADGAAQSSTYFFSDHVHPIDAAQPIIASIASAAINAVTAGTAGVTCTSQGNCGVGTATPNTLPGTGVTVGNSSNLQVAGTGTAGNARVIIAGEAGGTTPQAEAHWIVPTAPSGSRNWSAVATPAGSWTLSLNADNYSTSTPMLNCTSAGCVLFGTASGITYGIPSLGSCAGSCSTNANNPANTTWPFTDHLFSFNITPSSNLAAGAAIATVTFGKTWYTDATHTYTEHPICTFSGAGSPAAGISFGALSLSPTSVQIAAGMPLTAGTSYIVMANCSGDAEN